MPGLTPFVGFAILTKLSKVDADKADLKLELPQLKSDWIYARSEELATVLEKKVEKNPRQKLKEYHGS